MRWFNRSLVLCLLIVVLAPAPAYAWFEWLDYLSGPGPFKGVKVDVRVLCLGKATPYRRLREQLDTGFRKALYALPARNSVEIKEASAAWTAVFEGLKDNDEGLGLFAPDELETLANAMSGLFSIVFSTEQKADTLNARADQLKSFRDQIETKLNRHERSAVSIASSGIFVSLCSAEKRRKFGVEMGFTSLQANSNPAYANNHSIRLNTFTGGVSYRLPFKADRDLLDVGFNAGMYRFSSEGFETFSGLTIEPFIDIHGPTELVADKGLRRLAGLVTVRLGVVFFPAGFESSQFAGAPSKPARISGSEGSASATIFFDLAPLFRARP
jgi:hypothetical protein